MRREFPILEYDPTPTAIIESKHLCVLGAFAVNQ